MIVIFNKKKHKKHKLIKFKHGNEKYIKQKLAKMSGKGH